MNLQMSIICKFANGFLFDTKFENLVGVKSSIFKGGFRWVILSCEQNVQICKWFFNASRILKNSRIKSPPFSREDLGGLFTSCENEFANEHNLQICKWKKIAPEERTICSRKTKKQKKAPEERSVCRKKNKKSKEPQRGDLFVEI